MKFTTTEELIEEARKRNACTSGIEWAQGKPLQEVLETIPRVYRFWCLCEGFTQFAEHCDWEEMDGDDWSTLLSYQPQFAEHCDWSELNGDDWSWLLIEQPQFADRCNWSELDGVDWACLLLRQPKLAKHRPT